MREAPERCGKIRQTTIEARNKIRDTGAFPGSEYEIITAMIPWLEVPNEKEVEAAESIRKPQEGLPEGGGIP
jgi:hypothetical protein